MSTLVEKRNRLITEAAALNPATMSDETRVKFDAIMADVDIVDADIAREQRIAGLQAEQRTAARPPREGFEGTDTEKEKRAFRDWMRTGTISAENRQFLKVSETRDLLSAGTITTGTTGGNVLVPVGFDPQLHVAQKSYGAIVGSVRQLKTDGGGPIKASLADDVANGLTLISEATAVSELDPGLSGFVSYTDELTTGLVRISNSLLQDSAFDVEQFIQDTFAARYYKGLAKMIAQGNGSNIQALSTGTSIQNATGGSTSVTYTNLVHIFGALDAIYLDRSSWLMSSTTRAALMGILNANGNPILQADAAGNPFNSLFGRPIVLSPFSPGLTASAIPITFGDLTSYTLRTAGQLQVVRLAERYAEFNEVGFIGYARAGGYNTSQSSSPSLVSLQMSAT